MRCIQFSDARGLHDGYHCRRSCWTDERLAGIVKLQQTTQAIQQFETTTQLQELSNTVHDLSQVIKTTQTKFTPQQALRLPNLISPESPDVKILTGFWIKYQLC